MLLLFRVGRWDVLLVGNSLIGRWLHCLMSVGEWLRVDCEDGSEIQYMVLTFDRNYFFWSECMNPTWEQRLFI